MARPKDVDKYLKESATPPTYQECVDVLRQMSIQEQLDTIYFWTVSGVIDQRTFEQFLLKFFRQR